MGTEQGTPGDPRIMPGIDGKDKLNNPFARRIVNFFGKELMVPLRGIESARLGIENIAIRNAGIQAAELDVRLFRNDEFLDGIRQDVKALGNKSHNEGLEEEEKAKLKRLVEDLDEAKRVEKFRNGEKDRESAVEYIGYISHTVTKQFRPLVADLVDKDSISLDLTVEEIIALSFIRPEVKTELRKRAIKYLKSVGSIGYAIFKRFEKYFGSSGNGLYWKILEGEIHATPIQTLD